MIALEELNNLTKDQLIQTVVRLQTSELRYQRKASKYSRGFDIMMEYFDSIADELKQEVSDELDQIGL